MHPERKRNEKESRKVMRRKPCTSYNRVAMPAEPTEKTNQQPNTNWLPVSNDSRLQKHPSSKSPTSNEVVDT